MTSSHPAAGDVRRSYLPQLDGLRGLAIAAVAFHHFGFHPPAWIDWGPVGPSIFFLLSGYLITLSLEKMRGNATPGSGTFGGRLLEFHARRIGRLLPVVLLLLAIGVAVGLPGYRESWPWHAAFATNFLIVAKNEWPGSLSHLWSLSMQEQFYLLWPLVLAGSWRFLPWALGAVIAAAAAFRLLCLETGASEFARWFLLPGSLDAFATGGLVAWLTLHGWAQAIIAGRGRIMIALAAVAALIFSRYLRFWPNSIPATAAVELFECLFFGWLLLRLVTMRDGRLVRALSWRPLRFIGVVSYGIFIFHVLVGIALTRGLGEFGFTLANWPFLRAALSFAVSVGVAAVSWRWLEQPINQWVRHAEFDPVRWVELARRAVGWPHHQPGMRVFRPRWSLLATAGLTVWLALAWASPVPRSVNPPTDAWTIYKTTLDDNIDEDFLDFSEPMEIDNAPSFDVSDPPSA